VAAFLAATIVFPAGLTAQAPLQFLGFRPGVPREVLEQVVRGHGGPWACRRSTVDTRFTECQGRITPPGEPDLSLIASLVHDSVAVVLLSGAVAESDLRRWRADLDDRIGPATVRQSQGQTTWQWIRARRMIRITTRLDGGARVASVSLVDGVLLDGLEAPRARQ
jgi:hypothetical protein